MSWRGPSSRHCAPAGNTVLFEEMSQQWRDVGNTVSDLTSLKFEPQTSRSIDKRITARPTGRLKVNLLEIYHLLTYSFFHLLGQTWE